MAELSQPKRQALARLLEFEVKRNSQQYPRDIYYRDFCQFDTSLSKLLSDILSYRTSIHELRDANKKIFFERSNNLEELEIRSLKEDGYRVSHQILSPEFRFEVIKQISDCVFINRGIFDVELSGNQITEAIERGNIEKFTGANGDTFWVKDQNQLAQKDFFQKLAFDPYILSIVSGYLGCAPIHVQTNFWFSFPTFKNTNNLSTNGQIFHQDREFAKFIKVFIYLNDVDELNGPHIYVKGSHIDEAHTYGIPLTERISDAKITNIYDAERVKTLIGPAGTVAFGDTSCVHKGEAVQSGYRMMLQLEYAASLYLSPVCPFGDLSTIDAAVLNYRDDVRYRLLSNYNSKKRDEFTQLANNTNSVAVPPWRKVAQLLKRYLVN